MNRQTVQVGFTAASAAGTYHVGRHNAQAEAFYLAREGADPSEASRRAAIAVGLRAVWGLVWVGWCLPLYFAGWAAIVGGIHILAVSNGVPIEDEIGGTLSTTNGFAGLGLFVLGLILTVGFGYGGLLAAAHIWRWQERAIPGAPRKAWWRLYRRPAVQDIYRMDDAPAPRRGMGFNKVIGWIFIWLPLIAIPVMFAGGWLFTAGYRLLSGTGVA